MGPGDAGRHWLELRAASIWPLRQLVHTARETVHLAVPDGAEFVYLEKIDPHLATRMHSRVGHH